MRAPRVGFGLRALPVLIAAGLALQNPALAQSVPGPPPAAGLTAPELNPAARTPRPPPRDTDIFAPEPPGPCPLADSAVEVTLNAVTFRGATALSAADFAPSYRQFLGKPQRVGVICEIRDSAARALFDRGILARVEIPEQRIAGGALILDVIEAHVVNVRVRGDIGPAQAAVERYVEKLRGMRPFDMRKAQRYLLLASDIPGVRVRAAVRPSVSAERGAVDIDVSVSRNPFTVVGNAQNLGSRAVGPWSGLVRADARAFTALGEDTAIVVFHTLDSNEQAVVQLLETARVGGDGWIGRLSAVYGESRPGDVLKPLNLKSTSVVAEAEAAYPVVRSRRLNLNLAGGFDFINQQTDIGGGGTLTQDRLRVVYARTDGDLRATVLDHPVLASGSVTVRKGLSGLGASPAGGPRATRSLAQPDAWLIRMAGLVDTPVVSRISVTARLQAQYAAKPLSPYEQISLGDLSVGRGYDPAAVLGDSGVAGSLELRYNGLQIFPQVSATPFVFFDAGYVRNNDAARSGLDPSRTVRSYGAGVALRLANRANLEITYAYPIDSVAIGAIRTAPRLLVSLTASFL